MRFNRRINGSPGRNVFPKYPGVYAIVHLKSGRRYIGSATNIYNRWRDHRSQLRRGVHHSPWLQNAWRKFGENAFVFGVIEECDRDAEVLIAREQHWMDRFNDRLFNIIPQALVRLGQACPEWQKAALRERMLGNKLGLGKSYHGHLTENDVRSILHRYADGESSEDLAREFNAARPTISRIISRQIWRSVSVPPEIEAACHARRKTRARGEKNAHAKLNDQNVRDVRRRLAMGQSLVEIAKFYGTSPGAISHIKQGRTYTHVTWDDSLPLFLEP